MSNDYFNPSGAPATGASVSSAPIRSEFASIAAGFDRLPSLAGNALRFVRVNASGTGLEAVASPSFVGGSIDDAAVNLDGGSLVLPQGTATPPVNEGAVYWNSSTNKLTIGDGAAALQLVDLASAQTLSNKTVSGSFTGPLVGNVTGTVTGAASLNVLRAGDTMTGALVLPAGTVGAPSLAVGEAGTGLFRPSAAVLSMVASGAERMRIDANGRLGIGGNGNSFHRVTIYENTNSGGTLALESATTSVTPGLSISASRTSGARIENNDAIGNVQFLGYDGATGSGQALISAIVDGATATGSVPTRLSFFTTPTGSLVPRVCMALSQDGRLAAGPNVGHEDQFTFGGPNNANVVTTFRCASDTAGHEPIIVLRRRTAAYNNTPNNANLGLLLWDGITTTGNYTTFAGISALSGTNTANGAPSALVFSNNDGTNGRLEKMRLTAAGALVVGATSTNASRLGIVSADSAAIALLAGATRGVRIGSNSTASIIEGVDQTGVGSYQPIVVGGLEVSITTSATERMRINASGNVGIGTSPSYLLHLSQNGNAQMWITATNAGSNSAGISLENAGQRNWQMWADRATDRLVIGHNARANPIVRIADTGEVAIGGVTTTGVPLQVLRATDAQIRAFETGLSVDTRLTSIGGSGQAGVVGTYSNHPLVLFVNVAERVRIQTDGRLALGATSGANASLRVARAIDGSAFSSGVSIDSFVTNAVTSRADYFQSVHQTNAGATYGLVVGHQAQQGTFNGAVTTQVGFRADATMTGATNNYGFQGDIPAGTGRWNLFMSGTAVNFLAGALGVGIQPVVPLSVSGTARIHRQDTGSEGGELQFTRASDDGAAWSVDVWGSSGSTANSLRFIDQIALAVRMELSGAGDARMGASLSIGPSFSATPNAVGIEVGRTFTNLSGATGLYLRPTLTFSTPTGVGFGAYINPTISGASAMDEFVFVRAEGAISTAPVTVVGFDAMHGIGAVSTFGFRGQIASGTGRYNLYMSGTAPNYLAGDLRINTLDPWARLAINETTASTTGLDVRNSTSATPTVRVGNRATTGDNSLVVFATDDPLVSRGSITYNRAGGLTAYNTSSDYRAKTIVSPAVPRALDTLMAISARLGRMHGAEMDRPMFVAHELAEHAPYAVTGEKDAVDKDGVPVLQMVDESKIVPLLVAAIQELTREVRALRSLH